MRYIATTLALLLPAIASGRSLPRKSKSESFQVYAYGTGIGGLPMFSSGGLYPFPLENCF